MRKMMFMQLMLLTVALGLRAEEADSLLADTTHVDWYETPGMTDKIATLPTFRDMVELRPPS